MKAIRKKLRRLCRDERGATAIEYGLICALIAVAIVASLGNLAAKMDNMFMNVANAVQST